MQYFHKKLSRFRFIFKQNKPESEMGEPDKDLEEVEGKEKPKGKAAIPIDVDAKRAAARKRAEIARKKKEAAERKKKELERSEKLLKKQLERDGESESGFYKLDDLPGLKGKGLQSEVHINAPKDLSKYVDENGNRIKPQVIFFAHGKGQQDYNNAESKKIIKMVEDLRKKGKPVILVMVKDLSGKKENSWKDLDNPEAFKAIMKHTEDVIGEKINNISMASFSGGYKGLAYSLRNLRGAEDKDSQRYYRAAKQLLLLDSAYGEANEFAEWLAHQPENKIYSFNATVIEGNKELKAAIKEKMGNLDRLIVETGHNLGHTFDASKVMSALNNMLEDVEEKIEEEERIAKIPPRPENAMSGPDFIESIRGLPVAKQEAAILKQIESGNVPDFLRNFTTIKVKMKSADGAYYTAELKVMPDYLAIGGNRDFVRIPMGPRTAQKLAEKFGCVLPTSKMVNIVNSHADTRLAFVAFRKIGHALGIDDSELFYKTEKGELVPNGKLMMDPRFAEMQNQLINQMEPSGLTAGHKKDVIYLPGRDDRVAIYGGLTPGGSIIQPAAKPHGIDYKDYSHGIRLFGDTVKITAPDGTVTAMKIADVINHPELYKLLSKQQMDITKMYGSKAKLGGKTMDVPSDLDLQSELPRPSAVPINVPAFTQEAGPPGGIAGPAGGIPSSAPPAYEYSGYYSGAPAPEIQVQPPEEKEKIAPINSTFILGDSLNVAVTHLLGDKVPVKKELAKVSATSIDLLEMLKKYQERPEALKGEFANAIILIGTNDFGYKGPEYSAEAIFERIKTIWKILKDNGIKVYACTIPPFKGYKNYSSIYGAANNKRIEINKKIRESNMPFKVLDLAKKHSEGGLADDKDPDKLAASITSDNLHVHKQALSDIYLRELAPEESTTGAVGEEEPPAAASKATATRVEKTKATAEGTLETIATKNAKPATKEELNLSQADMFKKASPGQIPAGCKSWPGTPVPKKIQNKAAEVRKEWAFGSEITFECEGKTYVARVEPHGPYPKNMVGKPHKWHKGVTVYPKADEA